MGLLSSVQTTTERTRSEMPKRRVAYFGLTREKHCMNCGRMIFESNELYSNRFCSVRCKEEYCSPIRTIVKTI